MSRRCLASFMSIAGAAIAGLLVVKWGLYRCLMIGAVAVASTNVLFAVLSLATPELSYLAVVISADNISGGFCGDGVCGVSLSLRAATQYALFSSLMNQSLSLRWDTCDLSCGSAHSATLGRRRQSSSVYGPVFTPGAVQGN